MAALPFEIKNVTEEEDKVIKKYYKGYIRPFVRAGPSGYLLTPRYQDHAAEIYNLEVRAEDVWVVTFSRSGTTWLQELAWLVANDLDYETADKISLTKRFAYIEYPTQAPEVKKDTPSSNRGSATFDDFTTLPNLPSPRYVKSHLPLSLLPQDLLKAKVLYVARDPRDVAVSYFFMHKLFRYFDEDVEFKDFWGMFKKDLIMHMPIFAHIKEAWQQRNNPNLMFLFYEEMQKDLPNVIERVCKFFNKQYTAEQKEELAKHLSFDNMKKAHSYTTKPNDKDTEIKFMRKGKSGAWVDYFDEQMQKEAEEYMEKNLNDTDLRFPDVSR